MLGEEQLALFDANDEQLQKRKKINSALDQVVERFGSDAIVRGGQGEAKRAALSMQIKRGERDDDERR